MDNITQKEIKEIIKEKGEVKGAVLQTDAEHIRQTKGEGGLRLVEEKTKEFGYPIDYNAIRTLDWYPLWMRVVSLLAAKEVFNWENKEIMEMGNLAPKYSFIVKMLLSYFLTLKKSLEEAPIYWEKHYTAGEIEFIKLDEKEKYFIIRLKNFKIHPILCVYYAGYFKRYAHYVIKNRGITIEETKCMFKGDDCHEFMVRWE
jgi:hypothetical protein